MTYLLDAAQMQKTESYAIAQGKTDSYKMMEQAGHSCAKRIMQDFPLRKKKAPTILVLCGPGNNGGDGFVIARYLQLAGYLVKTILYGDVAKFPADTQINYTIWQSKHPVFPFEDAQIIANMAVQNEGFVVVDALFGTGLSRPLPSMMASMLQGLNAHTSLKGWVCVDIASGFCASSGRYLAAQTKDMPYLDRHPADLTISFHCPKIGHYSGDFPNFNKALHIADIGLSQDSTTQAGLPQEQLVRLVQTPPCDILKRGNAHKYDYGHLLVFSGKKNRTGAARLAAMAALRSGAGLVTLAAPKSALPECAAQLSAIMLRCCQNMVDLKTTLKKIRPAAIVFGPACGITKKNIQKITALLEKKYPIVLDADAISIIAANQKTLIPLLHTKVLLTPHMGEFFRLFPDLAMQWQHPPLKGPAFSRLDMASIAAQRLNCTILLKGADTVIAQPDGPSAVHGAYYTQATPWLATAGSGDVLAGIAGAFLARSMSPFDAAQSAAWLHSAAARHFGAGLIAEDLPAAIAVVLRKWEEQQR